MSNLWVPRRVGENELSNIMKSDDPRLVNYEARNKLSTGDESDPDDGWKEKVENKKKQVEQERMVPIVQDRGFIPDWMR